MKKEHIAILTTSANGHVYPVLGLSAELVRRGYRITFVTTDSYADKALLTGAEPVPFRSPWEHRKSEEPANTSELPPQGEEWWQKVAPRVYAGMCDSAEIMLTQLKAFYEADTPDLIIYDRWNFAGRILAKQLCVPAIRFFVNFAWYKNFVIRENGVCRTPEPVFAIARKIDEFFWRHGIAEDNNFWHQEKLTLHLIPREFQYHADYFDDRTCFVGVIQNRPYRRAWLNRSGGKPLIFVTNGDGYNNIRYYRVLVEAFANSEYYMVLSPSGSWATDELIGPLPDNFEIIRNISSLEVLPHASLAVTQGGTGNTLDPIYHGFPVVAVPMALPMNHSTAYRLAELGLGCHLPGSTFAVDSIRECVAKTLGDSEILNNVRNMQAAFRRSTAELMAADNIERFLQAEHA